MSRMSLSLLLLSAFALGCAAQTELRLDGVWEFQIDSLDAGIDHRATLPDKIELPGTMDLSRKGSPTPLVAKLERPQLLHLTRRYSYVGPAWYKRDIEISSQMAGRPLLLSLERVLWQSRLWVDGCEVGPAQESLTTPHRYQLPPLAAGRHTLAIRVDNSKQYDISVNNLAHAYTNDTQVMWNGILGDILLTAVPQIELGSLQVYPDIDSRRLRIELPVVSRCKGDKKIEIELEVEGRVAKEKRAVAPGRQLLSLEYAMPADAQLWSEFTPKVYTLNVAIRRFGAKRSVDFGLRSLSTQGERLLLNGRPIFLRGTLECCIFPLTGTPPTDDAGWQKIFATAHEYGLNHLRFHSWCPPEAAFRVADRMGFYLQVELPQWSLSVGSDSATTRFVADEFSRIWHEYGNHPSFLLMTCGNELQPDFGLLNAWVRQMRQSDPRHLYAASSFTFENGHGRQPEPNDQFFVTQYTHGGWVRGQGVFDAEEPAFDRDYAAATAQLGVPLISHEIGQYAVYPNLREIEKYTGTLVPLNFMAVRDHLAAKGLLRQADDWTQASGRLAALLYKEEIERALKSPGFSGFQLLDLHDFPGQGTALVGLLDAFWDSKGVVTPQEFRRSCAPVVALSKFAKAVYSPDETFEAELLLSNYSGEAIEQGRLSWQLASADGRLLADGAMEVVPVGVGQLGRVGRISVPLGAIGEATRLDLAVQLEGSDVANSWPVWVFPRHSAADMEAARGDVLLTADMEEALAALDKGWKVLFAPKKEAVQGLPGKFVPVFWSPVHFPDQAGAMGLLCNPEHPALAHFPTEMHTNWQWWHLLKNSTFMNLDALPQAEAVVSLVDNFTNNRRLATLFEARVGSGRLLMSSMELLGEGVSPAQVQMLYSLLRYINSPRFAPRGELTKEELSGLLR